MGAYEKSGKAVSPWSPILRVLFPLLTIIAVAVLVLAQVLVGTSLRIAGDAPFGTLTAHDVSNDNLYSAVTKLAAAGSWLMVIVVAIMSGLWPHIKLLGSGMIVWLVDQKIVAGQRAGKWLEWLGFFARLSYADVMVIAINYAAFLLDTPSYQLGTFGNFQVELHTCLTCAVPLLLIGLVISSFLTLWAKIELNWHTRSAFDGAPLEAEGKGPSNHVTAGLVASLALASGILLAVGSFLPFLYVQRSGFMGNLLSTEKRTTRFSLMDYLLCFRSEPWCMIATAVTVCVMFMLPLVENLMLVVYSMAVHLGAHRCSRWTQACAFALGYFSCTDVACLVAVIAKIEMPQMVAFHLGTECKNFEGMINNHALLSMIGLDFAASTECFKLKLGLMAGFWVLLASVILNYFAWYMVRKLDRHPVGELTTGTKS